MNNERTKSDRILTATVLAAVLMCLLCSCHATTRYVPVESVRTEYRDREVEKLVADTVHDTRVVWIKGDTVVDIREKEHVKRVEIHDTCYMERTDTIRIPYPVEKKLTRWESVKMQAGGAALTVTGALILAALIWLIAKTAKARTIWKRKN